MRPRPRTRPLPRHQHHGVSSHELTGAVCGHQQVGDLALHRFLQRAHALSGAVRRQRACDDVRVPPQLHGTPDAQTLGDAAQKDAGELEEVAT